MRVVVCYPDKAPEAIVLSGEGQGQPLDEAGLGRMFRQIVGGWLEAVPIREALPPGTVLYCNEEGKLKGLSESFAIPGDVVCGAVVATGVDADGNTRSLDETEAAAICRLLSTLRSFGGAS